MSPQIQNLLENCANCLKRFESDDDRVTRISFLKNNVQEDQQNEQDHEDHDMQEQITAQNDRSQEEDHIVRLTSTLNDYHQLPDDDQETETLELSVVTLQESHEGQLELTGIDGQHYQVAVGPSDAHRLIESGIRIIHVDKKPFLQALTVQQDDHQHHQQQTIESLVSNQNDDNGTYGDGSEEHVMQQHISAVGEEVPKIEDESVTVQEALSVVYEIPFSSFAPEGEKDQDGFAWGKDDPCALCQKCAHVLTTLYSSLREFNEMTDESSYVAKGVKKCIDRINAVNYVGVDEEVQIQIHQEQQVDPLTPVMIEKRIDDDIEDVPKQSKQRGRTVPTIIKRKSRTSKKLALSYQSAILPTKGKPQTIIPEVIFDTMDVDNDSEDEEMFYVDQASDVSSDSNSLSDLEKVITADLETRKTRVSTRHRTAKKQLSDFEELESSEEEQEEVYEDDEEEDPNFNAAEELEDIKVKQENLTLRRLTDICAEDVEFKDTDVEVDINGRYICPDKECGKSFKGIRTLNKHVVIHNLTKSKCPKCSKEFESLDELHRHMKTNHAITKVKRPPGRPPGRRRVGRPRKGEFMRKKVKRSNRYTNRNMQNECLECGKEFLSKSLLKQHLESEHNEGGPASCDICSKEFSTPYYLKRHAKDVHEKTEIDFSCPECGELLTSVEQLYCHFQESHGEKLNFCPNCGKSFIRERYLKKHLQETHRLSDVDVEPLLKVEAMPEVPENEENNVENLQLQEHSIEDPLREEGERKRKTDPTPYKCPHCEKEYKRKKQLDIHLLFHNGEEPQYHCQHCTKRFFQERSLKRHLLLHTTDNPHVCTMCDRVFPRADHLKRHMDNSHSEDKIARNKKTRKDLKDSVEHKCNDCEKVFTRKEYLRLHQRIHTGEKPYCCEECGKCFRDPRNLAQHLVTHKTDRPFCCSICGLTFKRAHHLNDHEGTHREDVARPFVCTLPNCGKAFKLKKHLISHELVHSGTKDHQCEICGKAFNRKDNLRQHVNKVHGKDSFSDLIRVPANCLTVQQGQQIQQVQIQVQTPTATLVPVSALPTTTTITMQLAPQVFQAIPTAHFTYTHL